MKQYVYGEEQECITVKENKKAYGKDVKYITILSLDEFQKDIEDFPKKSIFLHHMSQIQYCKIETFEDLVYGTMKIPKGNKGEFVLHKFGFCIKGNCLYLIGSQEYLDVILKDICENSYENYNLSQIFLVILEYLLKDDVLYLQKQEEQLERLEDELLNKIPKHFYEIILKYKRKLSIFHAYYEQLMNMASVMESSPSHSENREEAYGWRLLDSRAERLHSHIDLLREYLVQIRELYQSLIDIQQNKVMSMLTIVTTIFLPLTLIAGWYGMNFPNMPEFQFEHAYLVIILVSILIIISEIIYFKKKKML